MAMTVDAHAIKYELLPERFRSGAEHWIERGIPPGGFLLSCFENDLLNTLGFADSELRHFEKVREIAMWIHWETPSECHGSREIMTAWQKARKEVA